MIPGISPTDILAARILIVDDLEANVLLLDQMLRAEGYHAVSSTMDASKVCELHLLEKYDLILLDLQMPGMDGFQVIENLKEIEEGSYLPVLVITAQPGHKVRALRAGAKDFVSKPFDLAEVTARVHNMLEVRLLHLRTKALYERVVEEQEVSKRLLLEMLPRSIAERVRAHPEGADGGGDGLVAESWAEVAVLFSSAVELAKFSEGASAAVLAAVLDAVSTLLEEDDDAGRDALLGDAWLGTAGLPSAVAGHTVDAAKQALTLGGALDRFNRHSRYKLEVRIGLDSGPVLAAAGKKKRRKSS